LWRTFSPFDLSTQPFVYFGNQNLSARPFLVEAHLSSARYGFFQTKTLFTCHIGWRKYISVRWQASLLWSSIDIRLITSKFNTLKKERKDAGGTEPLTGKLVPCANASGMSTACIRTTELKINVLLPHETEERLHSKVIGDPSRWILRLWNRIHRRSQQSEASNSASVENELYCGKPGEDRVKIAIIKRARRLAAESRSNLCSFCSFIEGVSLRFAAFHGIHFIPFRLGNTELLRAPSSSLLERALGIIFNYLTP